MEAGDAGDAIPLTQPMFDGDVTDNDPPAPRLYAPVEPIHFKAPGPGDGDDDGSGRQHFRGGGLYSKAQRDRAAQRGHNAARNHVLCVAHRNMRRKPESVSRHLQDQASIE